MGVLTPGTRLKKHTLLGCVVLLMEGRCVRNGNHVMLFKFFTGGHLGASVVRRLPSAQVLRGFWVSY